MSSLGPGGTERQLVHLASTQAARGERVVVLVSRPLKGTDRHYVPNLGDAGVEVRELPRLGWALSNMVPQRELPAWARGRWPVPLRQSVEAHPARGSIIDLSEALRIESPDVLHCWLDAPNAIGGLAGLLAGVPRIVLSTRSVNPDHFPRLARTWYRASYRLLMHAPGVVAIANSRAGAIDYARWCGVSPGRFEVIPNGISLDASSLPGSIDRTSLRAAHGVPKGAFLVVGVFRFTEEKRPLDFVAAIDQLRARVPTAQAWMVGTGPELDAIRLEVERRGLADSIALLGGKADAERWLALADASLLPSRREGCPNVVLESQALGVPVVVTRGGGSPEVMVEGETGFACEVGDVDSMAERLAMLAEAPEQARAMGERGRALVSERFSVERMVAATLKAYLSAENEPRC